MAKIKNDKYYTPPELAEYCVRTTEHIIGAANITEYIESSAGSGSFLPYLYKPFWAYDIEPESEEIIQADWLDLDLTYKPGRCIIGNPPFGDRNTLSVQFFKKSIHICDYISFILPISQLNNNQQMYEFDLIHSEDLGVQKYSDRKIHCCLNIYQRPSSGQFNKKPVNKLKDVRIKEFRSRQASLENDDDFDIMICFWGTAIGKECERGEYSHIMGIKIVNAEIRDRTLEVIRKTVWTDIYRYVAAPALYQWQIVKRLREMIPEIE